MPSPGKLAPEGYEEHQGQAARNGQDEFHDPSGKYKLVMKGAMLKSLSRQPSTYRIDVA